MKKLKLLFAVAALLLGGNTAYSQSWTGNEPAEGTFFLYNVGAQKFINNGDPNENWGTNAYLQAGFGLDFVLEANNGAYNLNTNVSNGNNQNYLATSTWCDGNATPWTFTAVDGQTNTYTISNGDSYLVANSDLNDVVYGALTNDNKSWWKLVSLNDFKAAMLAKTYSATEPMDVSVFILGRSFARNDGRNNSWVTSHDGGNWTWIGSRNGSYNSPHYFGNEAYNNTFSVSQEITGLPEGTYEVKCSGFDTKGTTVIFGNNTSKALQTDNSTDRGTDMEAKWIAIHEDNAFAGQSTGTFTVGDGNLTVGVKRESKKGGDWCVWDEFRLYYYGLDLSEFAASLETAVKNAASYQGQIPAAAYSALSAVVTENNKTYTTAADYTNATNAINSAISTYASNAMVADYSRYISVKTAIKDINNEIDLASTDTQVEAATTTDDIDAAVTNARGALTTYIAGADIKDGNIDLTAALIDNASPYANADYWTVTNESGDAAAPNAFDNGNQCAEFWNQSGYSIKQTLVSLPVGYYTLTAVALAREGHVGILSAGKNTMNLVTANTNTANTRSMANTWFNNGNGVNALTFNLESASETTIGITADNANGDHWTVWRSFKLEYLGTAPLAKFQQDLTDAVDAANKHAADDLSGKIPTPALEAYTSAISTAAVKNSTTDECLQAIADIESATNIADALVLPYDAWLAMKAKADILVTVANDNSTANATLASAINTQEANAEAATTDADIESATSELKAAMTTYVFAANPVGDGAQFDCTFLMTNPDLTGLPIWNKCDGWTSEETDGNYQVMVNDSKTQGDKSYFYEYWSSPAKASGNFALYNAVTLPKGTFSMSCYAFAEDQYTNSTVDGVYFYANETQGSCVTATKLTEQNLTFVNNKEQEVKIGLKTVTGNTRNWMGIGYVELYKVPAKSYEIDETKAWDNTIAGAGDVTLKRTIKKGINTLVLPFSMTQAEVESNFGEGSKVYVAKAYNDATKNISFATNDGINANKPCLLEVPEAGNGEYSLKDRAIVAGEPVFNGTNVTTTGTYAESFTVPTTGYDYVISSGKIYNVDSEVTLKNTRAYITVAGGSAARTLTMSFDDETTGIATLKNGELKFEKGDIYDLSGRKVKNPTKGIYLMNGKKVIK